MTTTRKQYSPEFKAQVAVEAISGEQTLSQLGSRTRCTRVQIAKWRKPALERLPELFVDGRTRKRPRRRNGEGRAVRGDRAAEGRAGLAQKKSRHAR